MGRYREGFGAKAVSAAGIGGLAMLVFASLTIPFSGSSEAADVPITIGDNFFSPNAETVMVNDRVIWTNTGSNPHTVTSTTPSGVLDSGTLTNGDTYMFTFTSEGTFNYRCDFHPSTMTGSITVVGEIPEFQSGALAAAGMIILLVGLLIARRR